MIKQYTQVAIIGAGPSGSVAAALLKQQGIDCIVLEKSLFPRFSIGESLLPACMETLKKANMFEAVNQAGFQFKNGAAFRRRSEYTYFDFTDKYTPGEGETFQVQRASFDQLLAKQAQQQGVDIRFQHTVAAVDLDGVQPVLSINDENNTVYKIQADFILDASGYGRVLPRLLDLEQPSDFPARKAIFTHVVDNIDTDICQKMNYDRNKITIYVHPEHADVWYWLIPFSNGVCSLGVVGAPEFFEAYSQDSIQALKQLIDEEPHLRELFVNATLPNPGGVINGYSVDVKHLATTQYALLGNAGEFLDPVFSSGVTIAMKSAELAVETLLPQLKGETVDWDKSYSEPLMVGVNTFRAYVEGWYDGRLQKVIFAENPNAAVKQKISAILAGYAWDSSNPYVASPQKRLSTLAEICSS